jgi:hypothetical protein
MKKRITMMCTDVAKKKYRKNYTSVSYLVKSAFETDSLIKSRLKQFDVCIIG